MTGADLLMISANQARKDKVSQFQTASTIWLAAGSYLVEGEGASLASQLFMRVAVFSTKNYDREFLETANATCGHELVFFEPRLTEATTALAARFPAVCVFVNDQLSATVLNTLAGQGTRLIALRSAGFNNVDLIAACESGLTVVRVPAYSPYAVAEHTA